MSYYTHAKNAVYLQQLKYKYQTTKGITMRTYEDALSQYNRSKKPTRSKKWLAMPDSPRYLRNVSADHMGIHKTNDGAIYYRLYNTNVATFYPPEADGARKVVMNYYASQTTNIFMYEQGLNYHDLTTTEGKQVRVPYVASWDRASGSHKPSAELWFNQDGLLITERSSHRDIYTYKSSAEDKQKRKDFKAKVDTLMTLALFRLPEYRANVTIDENLGQPFGTAWRNAPREISRFEDVVRDLGADQTEHPQYIEAFLNLGQAVFDISASHKVYNYIPEGERWQGQLFRTWGKSADQLKAMLDKQHEVAEEVTAEEFKKAMTSRLLNVASLKTGSVKTPWGQFMSSIPRKYFV